MNNQVDIYGGSTETPTNCNEETQTMNNQVETPTKEEAKKGWRSKVLEQAVDWLTYKNKDKWLDNMRVTMGITATFIATITFQMALNPPGGVRSVKDDADTHGTYDPYANPPSATIADDLLSCDVQGRNGSLCPGEAVLAVIYPEDYFQFLLWNTICFIASLSVCLMLVSGIRFSHRFSMWLLSMGMCFTLTTLAVAYKNAVSMVTPDPVWGDAEGLLSKLLKIWIRLFCFLALLLTLRIIIWGINDFLKNREGKKATTPMIAPA